MSKRRAKKVQSTDLKDMVLTRRRDDSEGRTTSVSITLERVIYGCAGKNGSVARSQRLGLKHSMFQVMCYRTRTLLSATASFKKNPGCLCQDTITSAVAIFAQIGDSPVCLTSVKRYLCSECQDVAGVFVNDREMKGVLIDDPV